MRAHAGSYVCRDDCDEMLSLCIRAKPVGLYGWPRFERAAALEMGQWSAVGICGLRGSVERRDSSSQRLHVLPNLLVFFALLIVERR